MPFTVSVFADPGPRQFLLGSYPLETVHPFPMRLDKQGRRWMLAEIRPLPNHPGAVVYILHEDIMPIPTTHEFLQLCDPDPPYRDSLTNDLSLLPL